MATVFAKDVLACIAGEHHSVSATQTSLSLLLHETLLVREPGSGTREALDQALFAAGAKFPKQIELNDPQAIIAAVRAGLRISWISERLAHAQPGIKVVHVENFHAERPFVTLHRRDLAPRPVVQAFLREVLAF